ncbi:MAG: hypothetical protein ACUVRV_09080 [Cyanobacteriota bacterium]
MPWGSLLVRTRQALLSRLRNGLKGLLQVKPIVHTLTLTLGAMLVLGAINFSFIGKSVIDGLLLTVVVLTGGYGNIDDGLSLQQLTHDDDLMILCYPARRRQSEIFPKIWQKAGEQLLQKGDRLYVMRTVGSLIRLAQRRPFPPELYQVHLLEYRNAYFEDEILAALSFYARLAKTVLKPLLYHLPAVFSLPLPRDKALKLAQQLRKMSTEV